MKVGTGTNAKTVAEIRMAAGRIEGLGYDVIASSESGHNPFLPLVLAAEHTERVQLLTSIALAFVRSPMDMAYMAWDLQAMSNGRFLLGLGSQVRGHIVRRYGMEWVSPVPRMREYIQALRTIWDCFQNGTRLDFQGDHYRFNLMTPFFNPGPIGRPDVKIYLAVVNPGMLQVAGEVCDGVLLHPFNTPRYTEEVVLPNLEKGVARSGRTLSDLDIGAGGFIVARSTEEELEAARNATRSAIAHYASTRVYAPVMHCHGWGDTAEKLYRMSIDGEWSQMASQITDEMLEAFAVIGTFDEIADQVRARHASYATTVSLTLPEPAPPDDGPLRELVRELRAI